jgi:hypothetical protein
VRRRVIRLDFDGILRAKIGALVIFVAHVELCDAEIFVDALVVALDVLGLRKFAMDGGSFGRIIAIEGWVVGVGRVGVVAAAAGAAAARVVAGELRWRLRGEWMLRCGVGGGGRLIGIRIRSGSGSG